MSTDNQPLSRNNRGPRSRKRKTSVALTRIEHALASNKIVLPTEDAAEWERFHADVLAQFEPDGAIELSLASRIAELLWRVRRIGRAEQQAVDVLQVFRSSLLKDSKYLEEYARKQAELGGEADAGELTIEELMQSRDKWVAKYGMYTHTTIATEYMSRRREDLPVLMPDARELETLMHYEAHLTRVLRHTLHELEALQDRRNGNPAPLARIDVD